MQLYMDSKAHEQLLIDASFLRMVYCNLQIFSKSILTLKRAQIFEMEFEGRSQRTSEGVRSDKFVGWIRIYHGFHDDLLDVGRWGPARDFGLVSAVVLIKPSRDFGILGRIVDESVDVTGVNRSTQ